MKLLLAAALLVPVAAPAEQPLVPLRWTGIATVMTGRGPLKLGVRTRVAPSGEARGESWPLANPADIRTMEITPEGGWMERGGRRTALPAPMVAHERQQYALYGQMQLALRQARALARRGVRQVTTPPADAGGMPTMFTFDGQGRLTGGRNIVADPQEPARTIAQVFRFSRPRPVGGLPWPRRIEILQNGRPYFTLDITTITVDVPG